MKLLLIVITSIISLGFAALVIAVLFISNINLNDYKDLMSEEFTEQTGRELVITGNIQHSFYPWLGIQVEGLSISNPKNFSDTLFLTSEMAAFRIKLMPLLNQNYEIDTLQIKGAELNLEVNSTGFNNWSFATNENDENSDLGLSDSSDLALPFEKIIIGGVEIQDVSLNYKNQIAQQNIHADNVNISIPDLIYGEPLDLNMSLDLTSNSPALESSINLGSTVNYDLDNNIYTIENLNVDFLDSNLEANLLSNNGNISGSLSFNSDRTREIFSLIGQSELSETIDTMQLSMSFEGDIDDILLSPLQLDMNVSGEPLLPQTSISLAGNTRINLEDETLSINDFSLSALGLNTSGNFAISKFITQPSVIGEWKLASFNPTQLSKLLTYDLPATNDTEVLQLLSFSTRFSATDDSLKLNQFSMELDDSLISGTFSTSGFNNPEINFDINIDTINLDRYLAPEQQSTSNASNDEANELPIQSLRELKLKGDLSFGNLLFSGISLSDLVLGMEANQGLIDLSPIQASLYDGTYSGSLSLNASTITPSFNLESDFRDVAIEPLSQDFIGASYLSGEALIKLSLAGQGKDINSILADLNGNADLNLTDGIFSGVDVGSVLSQIETMLRSRRLVNITRGEQTAFDNLSANIQINNGIATSNDLLIESPGFRITGTGTLANLRTETLDFDLLTSVDPATASLESEEYDIGGYSLPIKCTGNINSPRCLPDIQSIFNAAVTNVIQEEVGGLLDRVLGRERNTDNTEPSGSEADQLSSPSEESRDPTEELLNRAIDRLFR